MAMRCRADFRPNPQTREYILQTLLSYWSARKKELIAISPGFHTDGASIPRWLHSIAGTPFDPRWMQEAALHDFLCRHGLYPRKTCDEIFFDALSENPTVSNARAQAFYRGVRIGSIYMEDRYKTRDNLGESLKKGAKP